MRSSPTDSSRPTGPDRPHPSDSSVVLTVRGVPSWGAVLVALVVSIAGILVSRALDLDSISWVFTVFFVAGIALAVLVVRRGSIFTAMVQAPILLTILVFGVHKLIDHKGTFMSATDIVASFPTMAIGTGIGLLLGLVRIIAQPAGRPVQAADMPRPADAHLDPLDGPARVTYSRNDQQNPW